MKPLVSCGDYLHKDQVEECVIFCLYYYPFVPGPKRRIWNDQGMIAYLC